MGMKTLNEEKSMAAKGKFVIWIERRERNKERLYLGRRVQGAKEICDLTIWVYIKGQIDQLYEHGQF